MSSEATQQSMGLYDFLAWVETNKKPLLIGVVAAIVLGFGYGIYQYSVHQKEFAASDALLKLKNSLGTGQNAAAPDPAAYLQITRDYAGTGAAERALLLAATAYFDAGKYAEAHEQFVKFLREYPQSPFAATAGYGAAACLEGQGKRDEALAAYQNLSVRFPNSTILDEAKLAMGRIHEVKNQPEQALRDYEDLIKAGTMTSAGAEAVQRKEAVLTKHPELAKTNAPAVNPSPTGSVQTNAPAAVLTNPPAKH
ncbi:MAG: tetratricopeptide repeat protein [Verrucomicrobiota bacterium]